LRTLQTLRDSCGQTSQSALFDHCRAQAEFIVRFPECDAECRALAAPFIPRPSR
jgi:hypothetical protein